MTLSTLKPLFQKGVSEFELLGVLQQPPHEFFSESALKDNVSMFQAHFVLFHALYLLRDGWRQSGIGDLDIFTTNIVLTAVYSQNRTDSATLLSDADPLRTYYLDLTNLVKTTEQDIDNLLASFWQKMATGFDYQTAPEDIEKAMAQLSLDALPASADVLKQHYRQHLHQVHPDKGGDHQATQEIIQAYRLLKRQFA